MSTHPPMQTPYIMRNQSDPAARRWTHNRAFRFVTLAAWLLANACLLLTPTSSLADGPGDNIPANVRRIPKLGIEVPEAVRQDLQQRLDQLASAIAGLEKSNQPRVAELLPDVRIFWQAVHDALHYQEFFAEREIEAARRLLDEGQLRAKQLAAGEAPWTTATGLVVRGYVSRIDGSVQPYGLVIPASYRSESADPFRLDLWFHGRGETLSEVNFLDQRGKQVGVFAPSNGIVLHPYGRYSNANKFAGEVDVLEAIDSVKQRYRIDPDRIVARGFSMGGASAWHLAVHYPGRWVAANPGAGFSETPDFLRTFQQEELSPTWWERKLWRWYDCTDWAGNLFHCPTVAYSGELDRQKQAADIMAVAAAREGIELVHVIGPETAHKYHPDAARDVESRITELARLGRERVPPVIDFKTYTLRYNKLRWLTIDGLGEHWEPARVAGRLHDGRISLTTENVTALTIDFEPGECPFRRTPEIEINSFVNGVRSKHLISEPPADVASAGGGLRSDRSARWSLALVGDTWQFGSLSASELRKRHGLQGPIDDAFMDSFVFVRPTGKCASQMVDDWTQAEMQRAIEHWRRHFRGHPRVKDDRDVTEEDIATMNLVLWGDAAANQVVAKIAERLPIRSTGDSLAVGTQSFGSEHHVPILVYPNPLNPERYVVLNSSFTFRDFAYLNNARQVAKLPDWAVIDVRTPANSLWPGKVVAADFFDERWQLKPFRAAKP